MPPLIPLERVLFVFGLKEGPLAEAARLKNEEAGDLLRLPIVM